MRRPRYRLQVSTFPFLAVLLGAMGSLIFLLLIMDRRAKIVARNKVREAQEARLAHTQAADDQRQAAQAAWERQRLQLHAELSEDERRLVAQLDGVHGELTSLHSRADNQGLRERELRDAVSRQQAELESSRKALQNRQTALLQSSQLEETTRADLARLTRELLEIEQTAAALKRLKAQQQPSYSLVPYRGKRGDNRLPIYVECRREGIFFLPDGPRFPGPELDVPAFRVEVERRHGPLAKQKRNADPFRTPTVEKPYVLFLVRPDGIPSYYRGQAALCDYDIDFGYEVVDAEWTLDVPSAEQLARLVAEEAQAPEFRPASRSPGEPSRVNGRVSPSDIPGPMTAPGAPSRVNSGTPGAPPLLGGPVAGAASPRATGESGGANKPAANLAGSAGPAPPGAAVVRPAPTANSLLDGPAPSTSVPGAAAGGARQDDGTPNPASQADTAPAGKSDAAPSAPVPENSEGKAIGRLAPNFPVTEKKTPSALTQPVVGSREFLITIACYADGVVVNPGGGRFNWSAAAKPRAVDAAVVSAVQQVMTRRQATVRPGEAGYRVVVKFIVHREGLRSLYRVYPLIETLRLPMVREDVED